MSHDTPTCPRHPGSTVWRDGTSGSDGRRRQRYRCRPSDGSPPHRFTEQLDAAITPRRFSYDAAEIASALVAVGKGMSYRSAARLVPRSPAPDGNSVADWVELFAPSIYARHAPKRWPSVVALDSVPFRARSRHVTGAPLPEEVPAFRILAALAHARDRPPQLVALRAVPGAAGRGAQAHWEEFLRSLEGVPQEVVCAPTRELLRAVDAVWRGEDAPLVLLSHSHLRRELLDLMRADGAVPGDDVIARANRAFASAGAWNTFRAGPRQRRRRELDDWLRRYGDRVAWQLQQRRGRVIDTTELEERLALLQHQLSGRRGTLANRERTNRLLMLTQLEMNRRADPSAYAAILEEDVRAHDGRAGSRRAIVDRAGASLRP